MLAKRRVNHLFLKQVYETAIKDTTFSLCRRTSMVSVYMYVPVDIIPMCALSADVDMEHRGMISTRTVIYTFYIRRDTRFPTFLSIVILLL